jgi:kynureninase
MANFRDMIAGEMPVCTPVVFNPIMAKLAEQAGFTALYLGGGTMGYVKTVLEANLTLPKWRRSEWKSAASAKYHWFSMPQPVGAIRCICGARSP